MTTYYSPYTSKDILYWKSNWSQNDLLLQQPGGFLVWTKNSSQSSGVYMCRIHQTVEATFPMGSLIYQINPVPQYIFLKLYGTPIYTFYFGSPSIYLNTLDSPRVVVTTNEILYFVFADNKFNQEKLQVSNIYVPQKILVGPKENEQIGAYCYFNDKNIHAWNFEDKIEYSSSSSSSSSVSTHFITEWNTLNIGDPQISLPLVSDGTYDFYVDWGDNSPIDHIIAWDQPQKTHTYNQHGTYIVTIRGVIKGWCFGFWGASNAQKLFGIKQWGNLKLKNNTYYFANCTNLTISATDVLDLTGVTSLYGMFFGCTNLTCSDSINRWNVSNITNMNHMFNMASSFNQNISDWDVSNVTAMDYMFAGASSFNQDISGWDVGNVVHFGAMFWRAYSFNQNIGNWDVSSGLYFGGMFSEAFSFDQNLGNWNVSNMINAAYMFDQVTLSTENYDALLIGWNSLPSLKSGVNFNGGNSKYTKPPSAAATARAELQAPPKNWIIIDGGPTS